MYIILSPNSTRVSNNDSDIQHDMETKNEDASSDNYEQVEHGRARCNSSMLDICSTEIFSTGASLIEIFSEQAQL